MLMVIVVFGVGVGLIGLEIVILIAIFIEGRRRSVQGRALNDSRPQQTPRTLDG